MLALVAAIAATGAGALTLAPSAQAAVCDQVSGVTVVVDFGEPGDTSLGCATGDPTTGLEALTKSGHGYTFLPRQPGFVCTIDARPDPCNNGPASAYWSYWHAKPGGSWSYATLGASSHNPEPGSVEGWSFGGGKPPSVTVSDTLATTGPTQPPSATRDLKPEGGSGLGGLALGVGLVVPIGAAAGYLAWRRRHVSS